MCSCISFRIRQKMMRRMLGLLMVGTVFVMTFVSNPTELLFTKHGKGVVRPTTRNLAPPSSGNEPVKAIPESEPVTKISESKPVRTIPKREPVTAIPESEPVTKISESKPVKAIPKREPVTAIPESEPVTKLSESKPVTTIPESEFKMNFKPQITDKYIIYLCDASRECGGWGDRQRGIVSLFLLSLVWKRRFGIRITTPCDIRASYRPTEDYNWVVTDEEIKGKSVNKTIEAFSPNHELLMDINYNASGTADVFFIRSNCFFFLDIAKKYANFLPDYLKGKDRAEIFREVWNRIMVPNTQLKDKVNTILAMGKVDRGAKKGEKELVCAHIRTGYSEFVPPDPVYLPLDSIPKIWKFFEQFNDSRMFIATDHGEVRKDAVVRYGERYIGSYSPLVHPDKSRLNLTRACFGQEAAYVEQLILTQCDVLLHYAFSGFSMHASYLKNNWKDVYTFTGGDIRAQNWA